MSLRQQISSQMLLFNAYIITILKKIQNDLTAPGLKCVFVMTRTQKTPN